MRSAAPIVRLLQTLRDRQDKHLRTPVVILAFQLHTIVRFHQLSLADLRGYGTFRGWRPFLVQFFQVHAVSGNKLQK